MFHKVLMYMGGGFMSGNGFMSGGFMSGECAVREQGLAGGGH